MENNNNAPHASVATHVAESEFKGYTMDQLRYQRALVALQKEFALSKIQRNLFNLEEHNPLSVRNRTKGKNRPFGSFAGKILSGLNYIDYVMLGYSLFGTVKKVYSFFHRK